MYVSSRIVSNAETRSAWLESFHQGDRDAFARMYEEHFSAVHGAVCRVVTGADAETVTHEVFLKLLSNRGSRESFRGGNVAAWLSRLGTNAAIDFRRHHRRETSVPSDALETARDERSERDETDLDAGDIVARFRRQVLPARYEPVFQKRFLEQLGQREAARALGMHRTTLMYQEHQIRRLLEAFVLGEVPR